MKAGTEAVIEAHVGVRNDDDASVPSAELHGEHVTVSGQNSEYVSEDTGETMVACNLSNGALAAVPKRALRVTEGRASVGYSRTYAENHRRIFGA